MKTLQHNVPLPKFSLKTLFFTLLAALLALGSLSVAVSARAQSANSMVRDGETARATGVVEMHRPGKRLVLADPETHVPVSYVYGPDVLFIAPGGEMLTPREIDRRIQAGFPVTLEYSPHGDSRVIHRVILESIPAR